MLPAILEQVCQGQPSEVEIEFARSAVKGALISLTRAEQHALINRLQMQPVNGLFCETHVRKEVALAVLACIKREKAIIMGAMRREALPPNTLPSLDECNDGSIDACVGLRV